MRGLPGPVLCIAFSPGIQAGNVRALPCLPEAGVHCHGLWGAEHRAGIAQIAGASAEMELRGAKSAGVGAGQGVRAAG